MTQIKAAITISAGYTYYTLLFADDQLIIRETEEKLGQAVNQLHLIVQGMG